MSTLRLTTLSNQSGSASVPSDTVINGSAKAWVNFNGQSTVSIRAAFNVSSITDDGTGKYRVNFNTAMPDNKYSIVISTEESGTTCFTSQDNTYQHTASSAYVKCLLGTGDTGYDPEQFNVTVFR